MPKRPLSVSLLCFAVLIVAMMNLIRLSQSLANWGFLTLLLPFHPVYLAVTGLVWGALAVLVALRLWQGKAWARGFSLLFIILYSACSWVERVLLSGYPGRNANWPFSLGLNLLLILLSVWILNRPQAKQFFEATDERQSKNPTLA